MEEQPAIVANTSKGAKKSRERLTGWLLIFRTTENTGVLTTTWWHSPRGILQLHSEVIRFASGSRQNNISRNGLSVRESVIFGAKRRTGGWRRAIGVRDDSLCSFNALATNGLSHTLCLTQGIATTRENPSSLIRARESTSVGEKTLSWCERYRSWWRCWRSVWLRRGSRLS